MTEQSQLLTQTADQYAKDHCGQGIIPLSTWRLRKEELAHERQKQEQIQSGLISVWSCLESAFSYRAHFCEKPGYPQRWNYQTRCKHLYFYFDHQDYGFMNISLQTWFPYHIQICLNGREWLRRSLEKENNEQNNLRVETSINNPVKFRVHRHKHGQSNDEPKERLPLRKGVMDTTLRAKVSQEVNDQSSMPFHCCGMKHLPGKISMMSHLLRSTRVAAFVHLSLPEKILSSMSCWATQNSECQA